MSAVIDRLIAKIRAAFTIVPESLHDGAGIASVIPESVLVWVADEIFLRVGPVENTVAEFQIFARQILLYKFLGINFLSERLKGHDGRYALAAGRPFFHLIDGRGVNKNHFLYAPFLKLCPVLPRAFRL